MSILTGYGLGTLAVSSEEPVDVLLSVLLESWSSFTNDGLPLVALYLQCTKFLGGLWNRFGLERDAAHLAFLFSWISDLESCVKRDAALPE